MMLSILALGFFLGLGIVSSPGVSMLFMVSETLSKGFRNGLACMFAQMSADALIIIPAAFLAGALPDEARSVLNVLGGIFLVFIGINGMRGISKQKSIRENSNIKNRKILDSFVRAFGMHITNFPVYLFWIAVGAGQMTKAQSACGTFCFLLFPIGFWIGGLLVETVIVALVEKGKKPIGEKWIWRIRMISSGIFIAAGIYLLSKTFI